MRKLPRRLDRAFLLLVLSAILPLLIISAVMGVRDLRQQRETMKRQAMDATGRLSDKVRREVTAVQDTLMVLAASPQLDGTLDADRFRTLIERARVVMPVLTKISLRTPEGRTLAVATSRTADVAKPKGGAATPPLDDRDSFRAAVDRAEPSIGHMTQMEEGIVFAVRVPVVKDGKVAYVVSGLVDPEPIRNLLKSTGLPRGWIGYVIDNSGRIVARTEPGRVGQVANASALGARKRESDGFYESDFNPSGVPKVVSFHVIPDTGWSVHVAIPRDLYEEPFVRSEWLIAVTVALGLGMATTFLLLLSREVRLRRETRGQADDMERLETLGRLTGGVAHDFNNILTIVMGSADTLKRRRSDPAKVDALADMMLSAAKTGQGLTSQLLAYARRSAHAPVSFCLGDRVADLTMLVERSTRPDVKTSIAFPNEIWPLMSDPRALDDAVINLAVNARDAMPTGGRLAITARNVSLTKVRDHRTGLKGDFVVVSVQDTGTGIPPEILGRIFDPFFTTKSTGKGTGLGLSQVYGFARQSGGEVRVVSNVGRGTRFDIYLPRSKEPPLRPAAVESGEDVVDTGRLLLVEDNPAVAELAREMMAASGYEVVYVPSAEEAIALVEGEGKFDAMLSDIMLEGGMSGLDAAPIVQARRPDLPIVLMTGYSEALASGSSRGFPVVSKPFQRAEVVKAIIGARARKLRERAAREADAEATAVDAAA